MPFSSKAILSSKTMWLLPHSRSDWWWVAAILVLVAIYIFFFSAMKLWSYDIYFQYQEKQLELLPQYVLGSDLEFCDTCGGFRQTARLEGWSHPERWGMWSDGKQASLGIRLPEQLPDQLLLIVRFNIAIGVVGQQAIDLVVNGQKIAHWIFHDREQQVRQVISRSIATLRQPMRVSFVIDHPVAPASLSSSSDERLLGVGLRELRIEENH
jgi:uncharacterized protein DUF7024